MSEYGEVYLLEEECWVACLNEETVDGRDWVQVGKSKNLKFGESYYKKFGEKPIWETSKDAVITKNSILFWAVLNDKEAI